MERLKKTEIEYIVNGLDEFVQKLDGIAAIIFTFIHVKGESGSEQQQPCYFCYNHFVDSGWTSCGSIISFLNAIVDCFYTECFVSSMRPTCYLLLVTENDFKLQFLLTFRSFIQTHQKFQSIFSPMSQTLSSTLNHH